MGERRVGSPLPLLRQHRGGYWTEPKGSLAQSFIRRKIFWAAAVLSAHYMLQLPIRQPRLLSRGAQACGDQDAEDAGETQGRGEIYAGRRVEGTCQA